MQSKIAEIAKAAEGLAKALVPFAEATEVSNPRRDLDQRKPWLFGSGTPITLGDVFRLHDALIGWQEANK